MVVRSLGSQKLVGSDLALPWASQTMNHLAVLRCLMHLPDMLLDSMKSLDDSSTPDCRLEYKDHSFADGKQHSTVARGCPPLDLGSIDNLLCNELEIGS